MNKELCQKCLKEKLNKQNPPNIKSTKEQLQQELKRWEELGLEQYLANSKQAYLNQIETLEEQLKNHE